MVQLHAALVPPPEVVARVSALLASVSPPAPPTRRGLFGRRQVIPAEPSPPQLDLIDPSQVRVPITSFGNLTPVDVRRITDAIAETCQELPPLAVALTGGVAMEPIGTTGVGIRVQTVDGDPGALASVVHSIVGAVESVGLFCDRRGYRQVIDLATVNDHTDEAYLQRVLDAFDAVDPIGWVVDSVVVLRRVHNAGAAESVEVERLDLRGPEPS